METQNESDEDAEVGRNMRKAQKKQAENFTALLRSAHTEIKKALEAGNSALAMDLLEQCQAGVIELGETIEAAEGEGFVTVGYVESYCEQLYQIYEQVRVLPGINAHKVQKTLNKSLVQLENSIKNDVPARIEAVFLPYKASMWDSLESVWRAADEDPDCDAYVIPIPYFDRDAEGNFAEMHDESRLYPDDVPITRYDAYDFAGRRPDMIFIHNPYDNNNYVTSVHPAFYSDKLKQYTDKLVYIPYFILGEVDLENEEAVKGMAHFVTTPAVVNADKVIVQSENMRQAYIKVMVMLTGEQTRGYWEEKILGLGSPKIDKVMATRKEDVEVPEEWLKVIEKEDGSWKKIIFYNTSVSALLNHNEKMMAKIKDVLQVFKENREDVALLWRPHPLMEATIKSVRPRLWEEYRGIVDTYKAEGWGIYDDTADMNRAVALSDAYYGDASSVLQLYRQMGKVSIIQNINFLDNVNGKSSIGILSLGAYTDGRHCWLPSREINALFFMDLLKNTINYCEAFTSDKEFETKNIYKVIFFENKLFFFSRFSYKVWILNIHTNKMDEYCYYLDNVISIRNIEKVYDEAWIFSDSYKDPIICLNLKSKKSIILNWKSEHYNNMKEGCFTRTIKKDERLYLATRQKNGTNIYIINCLKRKITYKSINSISFVNCMTILENDIWLLGTNCLGQIVLVAFDIKTWKQKKEIKLLETEKLEGKGTEILKYFEMISFQNKIFLIPALARTVICYDVATNIELKLNYPNCFQWKEQDIWSIFAHTEQIEQRLYLYPFLSEQILILDMHKLKFETINVMCESQEYNKAYLNLLYHNILTLYEDKSSLIRSIINFVNNKKYECGTTEQKKYGKRIYLQNKK